MLARDFGLDAAPTRTVARNHDRALDRDSQAIELLIIFAIAVVHVHQRRGYVSIDGIGVVGRKLLGGLVAGGIDCQDRFLQLGLKSGRLQHFNHANLRRGKQNVEALDLRVESPLFEL